MDTLEQCTMKQLNIQKDQSLLKEGDAVYTIEKEPLLWAPFIQPYDSNEHCSQLD